MKKRIMLAMLLVVCVAALCACKSAEEPQRFQVMTQPTQAAVAMTNPPVEVVPDVFDYDNSGYDPASEEGRLDDYGNVFDYAQEYVTAAPTMNSAYAGATPVVIDPIDKPTATPVPSISFSEYQAYDATNLRLSFQAPAGWVSDASEADKFTITNPDPKMAFQGFVTLGVQSTSGSYNKTQLTSLVKEMLTSVKSNYGGRNWNPTKTASRTLLDATGIYADYAVTLDGGVEVKGRVQAAYHNGKLYTVHMACPAPYFETYKKSVYNKLRDTITVTK